MSFAEFERSLITSRLSGGRNTKAKGGQHAGVRTPLGYKAENKTLVLDPIEAKAVKMVFELRSSGLSMSGIARIMNAEGYITKAGKFLSGHASQADLGSCGPLSRRIRVLRHQEPREAREVANFLNCK